MAAATRRRGPRIHLDDVDHFRGFGWSIERIADRLGVKADSVQQALRRAERRTDEPSTQQDAA